MNKGDIVTIHDGSYTRSVVAGKLISEFLNYGNLRGRRYVIIETGCIFPAELGQISSEYTASSFNNTVIQDILSHKVVFIEERFLSLVVESIREVTMSEVCRQFGEEVKIKK